MIKVASYNMRKGIGLDRRRNPGRVLSVLGELDADIVALQEADRRFGTRASAIPPHMFEEHSDYVPVDLLGGRSADAFDLLIGVCPMFADRTLPKLLRLQHQLQERGAQDQADAKSI